jgi:hypothetical protein
VAISHAGGDRNSRKEKEPPIGTRLTACLLVIDLFPFLRLTCMFGVEISPKAGECEEGKEIDA